jgi:hypothetical protein
MGHVARLDVFIYSRGGAIDVPWRIATALRTAADEWNILIPFRANSAATSRLGRTAQQRFLHSAPMGSCWDGKENSAPSTQS